MKSFKFTKRQMVAVVNTPRVDTELTWIAKNGAKKRATVRLPKVIPETKSNYLVLETAPLISVPAQKVYNRGGKYVTVSLDKLLSIRLHPHDYYENAGPRRSTQRMLARLRSKRKISIVQDDYGMKIASARK